MAIPGQSKSFMRSLAMNKILQLIFLAGLLAAVPVANISAQDAQELYYDASKQKTLGNYDKAIDLFDQYLDKVPDDAAALYELGSIYFKQNRLDEALEKVGKAVTIDPSNEWYKTLLVQIYQEQKDYRSAEKIIKRMIEDDPNDYEHRQDLALNYIYQGEYMDAIEVYNDLEERIGVNEQISIQKQKLYLLLGKGNDAIEEIRKLTETFPEEVRFLEMLAEMYVTEEKWDEALETYEKILEVDPDNPYINISLSDYYRKTGNKEKSYEYLKAGFSNPSLDIDAKVQILLAYYSVNEIYNELKDEAFSLAEILVNTHPDDPKAHSIYADLLYQDDRFEEARESFRKVISLDSSKYLVWEQLLFVESELGDFEAMANESVRAIDLFPQQPLLYLFSGVANFQLKNYELAAEHLETGVNFVVGNDQMKAQFYSYLGDAYNELEDFEKSDKSYDKSLELDPDNSIVLNNYAYYLSLRDQNLEKAKEMAGKAIELDPENGANHDTYGWVLYKMGRYEEAKKWIGKAVENRDTSAVVLEHYGDVLYKLGDKKEAVKYWEKAIKKGEGSEFLERKVRDKKLYE